jgi:hypothetical protein
MKWIRFAEGKSGKREVAIALLLMWAFASAYLFFWIDPSIIEKYEAIWDTLTWAVFLFAAGAFGIDFAAKKGMLGGGRPPYQPPTQQRPQRVDDAPEGPL